LEIGFSQQALRFGEIQASLGGPQLSFSLLQMDLFHGRVESNEDIVLLHARAECNWLLRVGRVATERLNASGPRRSIHVCRFLRLERAVGLHDIRGLLRRIYESADCERSNQKDDDSRSHTSFWGWTAAEKVMYFESAIVVRPRRTTT